MTVNARRKINELFETDEAAEVFDYLAKDRKPTTANQLANYLGISPKKTKEALESLEKKHIVTSSNTGVLGIVPSFHFYAINSAGLEKYQELKSIK